jgi:hypothetical protein
VQTVVQVLVVLVLVVLVVSRYWRGRAYAQLPVTARALQGMAPYPGQARCLAVGCWPECFRRLDVRGGRRPFPEETRSALDIEGKHVTIQGPSPDLSPGSPFAPSSGCQDLLIRSSMCGHPHSFRSVRHLGGVPVGCPLQSGEPASRSSVWLPAWLPADANGALSRCRSSLGYEKREAGFRCLAWSPAARLTWPDVMRLVSEETSRLSVHTSFRGVSCTDSCTPDIVHGPCHRTRSAGRPVASAIAAAEP